MSNKFRLNYEAPTEQERKEIESIRAQYMPVDSRIARIKSLDSKIKSMPTAISISIGVIGLLLFGLGMTFFLEWVHLWYCGIFPIVVGLVLIIVAYPVYNRSSMKMRTKYQDEILSLSNEVLKEDE